MLPEGLTLQNINEMDADSLLRYVFKHKCIKELVDVGFDVNKRYYESEGTLFHFMGSYDMDYWDEFIKYCPDINVLNRYGDTLLNFAVFLDVSIEYIQLLMKTDIDLKIVDCNNRSALENSDYSDMGNSIPEETELIASNMSLDDATWELSRNYCHKGITIEILKRKFELKIQKQNATIKKTNQ